LRPLLIIFLFLFQQASAQEFKYLIHLKNKNNNGFSVSDPTAFLSEQSIQRRQKQNIPIDSTDLPITAAYTDSLSALPSLRILNKSRWFNQLLISITDTNVLQQVRAFSFVLSSEPVNNQWLEKIKDRVSVNRQKTDNRVSLSESPFNSSGIFSYYNYGSSYTQIHIHHGDFLHDLGFRGENMTIAILDNGFNNYLTNPAFDSVRNDHRILGTYDFVHLKQSVNEEELHGAYCFSILASNIPQTMIGTAPAARYWLFKTEDDLSETPVEEQNWVTAAEFADSVGVDLISTSLGYAYFDDSLYDLDYAERDGHTALISRAANLAVAKGIIVTAAAGNSGSELDEKKFVICPADGDSVFAVGSVDSKGLIGSFSSWGPNASGQAKPDGVSVGVGTSLIANDGILHTGNGTSFANPNLAGLITCLWQAFPEFSAHDILAAVRQSSDKYRNPDNRYGFGLPDFEKAYHNLLIKRLAGTNPLTAADWIRVFPVPFDQMIHISLLPDVSGNASIQLLDISGKIIQTVSIPITADEVQFFEFNVKQPLARGAYIIHYEDQKQSKTIKILKN
jgi:serine protease AprX